jgi:NodT family efflux transporter outer membrane factor (OMF) lipoprotein
MRLGVVLAALLAGCAVGPNFERPPAPSAATYTAAPLPAGFVENQDIPGEWWTLFHSQPLNDLIERALRANPDLRAAQAALVAARENALAQRGAFYPSVDASVAVSHNKTSQQISPTPSSGESIYSLYTPELVVSYAPDVFGLTRRTVEAADAQTAQQRFALVATHLTLTSNVAVGAIQEAVLRAQIDATHELIAINTDMLQALEHQFVKGYVGRLDVAAQQSQLAQVQATLPPLLKRLAQQRDLLTALSGSFPDDELPEQFALASLELPSELPVTLPSRLVEQRPDVREAEESLHAASARVGIAVANRLPNFTLSADVGTMALTAATVFAGGAGFWTLAASAAQPIFHGGTLLHDERAARAELDQAAAQYQSTVVSACQNVADSLHAIQQDGEALTAATAAKDAAAVTLKLSTNQFRAGYAGYLSVLNAEQTYQQAMLNLVQAQADRYSDTVALFQSLGGGWWNRTELN